MARRLAVLPAVTLGLVVLLAGCADRQALPRTVGSVTASNQNPALEVPNHVNNNAWKQRIDPTEADLAVGTVTADRIRVALGELRRADDISPETTEDAIEGLGLRPTDVSVVALRVPPGAGTATAPPGAEFGVRAAPTACVIGSVGPSGVHVRVAGPAAEFGCLEPFSH